MKLFGIAQTKELRSGFFTVANVNPLDFLIKPVALLEDDRVRVYEPKTSPNTNKGK